MDATLEVEDDLFFADLSKQIALLIMDEEEEEKPVITCPSVTPQVYSKVVYAPVQPLYFYEQACRRESKGTGVFIPMSSQPTKRKNRQGRFSSFKSKSCKKPDSTKGLSHISYNDYSYPNRFQE